MQPFFGGCILYIESWFNTIKIIMTSKTQNIKSIKRTNNVLWIIIWERLSGARTNVIMTKQNQLKQFLTVLIRVVVLFAVVYTINCVLLSYVVVCRIIIYGFKARAYYRILRYKNYYLKWNEMKCKLNKETTRRCCSVSSFLKYYFVFFLLQISF